MKRILLFLLAVVAVSACCPKDSDEGFVIEKGVNIAHWLSQSGARGDIFDELGIARAVWCYREGEDGFGILSGMEGPIDQQMLEALLK